MPLGNIVLVYVMFWVATVSLTHVFFSFAYFPMAGAEERCRGGM